MSRRDLIRMTDDEIDTFLDVERIVQVATLDHDGFPHLVAMWYVVINREITFWTYTKSQKAVNLRRDPRLTCLVEAGEDYSQLRGVQVKGRSVLHDQRDYVQTVGQMLWERYTGPLNASTRSMVVAQAAKRVAIAVKPAEIVSWDHRKLGGLY